MPSAEHPTDRQARRHGRRRAAHALAVSSALVGVAALVAGCGGGGSSPGVASIGNSKAASSQSPDAGGGAAGSGAGPVAGGPGASSSGGGGGQFEASIGGGSRQNALKFAACMRTNGVPNFPDPNGQGAIQFGSSDGINPNSPQFEAAMKKCQKYMGAGKPPSPAKQAQAQAQALKFSACMRSHGVPSFPDPDLSGGGVGFHIHAGPGSGLDPRSPIFQAAQKACGSDLPGANGPPPVALGG